MRSSICLRRGVLPFALLTVVAVAMIVAGCGKSGTDAGMVAPPTAGPSPHTAASGQAITDKLAFDQLTLESPAKPVQDKHGLTFLRFKYADSDGKVYECVLPQAMSEGQYTLAEWSSTFNAYRLPKVLAQKKITKESLGDFPFISPKPQPQPDQQQQAPQPSGAMPTLPAPTLPPSQPSGPGGPGGPMPPPP